MPAIYPLISSRVSELLLQQRMLSQFEFDKRELVRLQDQISTGYRLSVPSDDAPAATRAMALQRLLEQKQQARVNVTTNQSYVAAADAALSSVSELLANIKAQALTATNSTNSQSQREVLSAEVRHAIEQLTDIGNRRFRDRALFAGSRSERNPFQIRGENVVYHGNETALRSILDVDFFLDANVTGDAVFGAISPEVRGTTDLNPVLTLDTRLRDLRGGLGISQGSFLISDGNSTKTVSIESAETIRDLVRLIESNPPTGRELNVRLSSTGLLLDLDDAGGGGLTIREVAGGSTARELGILEPLGVGTGVLVGDDLDPLLLPTTRIKDILGTRAQGLLEVSGAHNDIFIEAVPNGASLNGVQVELFSSGSLAGDAASASFDSQTQTLRIDINPGVTRAASVVDAINTTGLFQATLDDKLDGGNNGTGLVDLLATAALDGGSGADLDLTSGLRIINGGATHTITFEDAETVEDLLNRLNGSAADVLASISADGRRLDVRSRLSGTDFQIGENGGTTATQLGVRTLTRETLLGDLNYGRGIDLKGGNDALVGDQPYTGLDDQHVDFVIQRRDGTQLDIDVSSAITVGDVIDIINSAAGETIARLVSVGNGIELVDANAAGAQPLTITRADSFAAWDLGLLARNTPSAAGVVDGPTERITGADVHPLETKGAFNSLLRLDQAILDFDLPAIERAIAMLDEDFDRLTFTRAELGAREQSLEALTQRLEDEEVQLRATLSLEIDADLVEAISNLSSRQANMEATLRLMGQTMQLSLLDFL